MNKIVSYPHTKKSWDVIKSVAGEIMYYGAIISIIGSLIWAVMSEVA